MARIKYSSFSSLLPELRFYQFEYAGETLVRQLRAEPQFRPHNPAVTGLSVYI